MGTPTELALRLPASQADEPDPSVVALQAAQAALLDALAMAQSELERLKLEQALARKQGEAWEGITQLRATVGTIRACSEGLGVLRQKRDPRPRGGK